MEGDKTRAEIFGENLERILREKKMSRKELAIKLNVTIATVGAYINAVREPSLDKLFEIAKILDVSIVDLLGENPNVEDKLFEYRLQRTIQIANKAGVSVKIDNDKLEVSFYEDDDVGILKSVNRKVKIDKDLFIQLVEIEEERASLLFIGDFLKDDLKQIDEQ